MDENMIPNIDVEENTAPAEEVAEAVEETVDVAPEVVEEVAPAEEEVVEETVEEAAEEIVEEVEDVLEEVEEAFEDEDVTIVFDETLEPTEVKAKGKAGKIVAIAVVAAVVVAAVVFGLFKVLNRNPYNEMGYVNVSGRTIAEVAADSGVELDQFLANYGLPADMPADTEEAAAYYNIPVKYIAEMYGMDVASIKEMLGLGDDVTEDTPWGEAEGKSPLSKYVGEDNLEAFKAEYGLGDDVTGETLWGEIRNIVDNKTLADREAQEQMDAEGVEDGVTDGEEDPETEPTGEEVEEPAAE